MAKKIIMTEFHGDFQHTLVICGNTLKFKEVRISDGKVLQDVRLAFDSQKEMAERLLPCLDEADESNKEENNV